MKNEKSLCDKCKCSNEIKSTSFCIEILKKKSIISGDLKKEYKF